VPLLIVLVGAWHYRWVDEDAFIDFRIVSNVLAGHGPVYNVGERVETYSDPLWVAALVALRGVFPFVAIEWWSVILGLVTTAGGVLLGGRGVQRLMSRHYPNGLVVPIGLVMFSVVAGVWEFATSGLEMGMVFLWLGLSFWLLVRLAEKRRTPEWAALVATLGPLIRPELLLMAAVFAVAVAVLIGLPGWAGPSSLLRRWIRPLVAALVVPVVYELWRMAYFALLVPNTGLAKAAGAAWWSQGLDYLWNFIAPYTLWVPLLASVPFVYLFGRRSWRERDWPTLVVTAAPLLAAMVETLYVVRVGGDYMHARLLLPAFFASCLVIAWPTETLRHWLLFPAMVIVVWAVICAGWLRNTDHGQQVVIVNSRTNTIMTTGRAHPITTTDYGQSILGALGFSLKELTAKSSAAPGQRILYGYFATTPGNEAVASQIVTPAGAIGVIGYLAGPSVYIFDTQSLANPIGSHTTTLLHSRPGHEKPIDPVWMFGRFGVRGRSLSVGGPTPVSVAAARETLSCGPLSSYLHAVTSPWNFGTAVSNLFDSFGYTTLKFNADPAKAIHQVCHHGLTSKFLPKPGYWLLSADGAVTGFNAPSFGSAAARCRTGSDKDNLLACGTAIVGSTDGGGYTIASTPPTSATGRPLSGFGEASNQGSPCLMYVNGRFVKPGAVPVAWEGIAQAPSSPNSYWLVGRNALASCGNATLFGSPPTETLGSWTGIASTLSGKGYWITTSAGQVFAFGDARFYGSMAGHRLNGPVDGIVTTADAGGYWLVATDGGVFSFGDARFSGSLGAHPYKLPIVGLSANPDGSGYWAVARDGTVFAFGEAPYRGSLAADDGSNPVVGIASRAG
jgi:arabinofuranosyltransferase